LLTSVPTLSIVTDVILDIVNDGQTEALCARLSLSLSIDSVAGDELVHLFMNESRQDAELGTN